MCISYMYIYYHNTRYIEILYGFNSKPTWCNTVFAFFGCIVGILEAVCNVVPLPCQQHYNYGNYTFRDANASNFQSIPFWIPASTFFSKVKQIFVSKTVEWAAKFTRHQLYISACHWVKPSWTWSIVLRERRASSPITPPETNSSPLKIGRQKSQRKVSSSNHPFSGAKC